MTNRKEFKSVLRKGLRLAMQTSLALLILLLVPPLVAAAPLAQSDPWWADYFPNRTLSGSPALRRYDEEINFDWGYGAPFLGLPADEFSVRWTTQQSFAAGLYTFNVAADDGARLYVDGELVLDGWQGVNGSESVTRYLSAGEHTIVLEYFEQTGVAQVQLNWYNR